jgi:hypothetical protein
VDIVVECTGKFKSRHALAPHLQQGVKKVLVSAPVKDGTLNIVMGVNDQLYDPAAHHIVTAASAFGHPSPSKQQKLNATANASGAPDVLRTCHFATTIVNSVLAS